MAYGWVHEAAHILGAEGESGPAVRGRLGGAIDHFLKVTRSYWPGLFACYDTPDLPRTNNVLSSSSAATGTTSVGPRVARGRRRLWCCGGRLG